MDRLEFIEQFQHARADIDMKDIDKVVADCLDRCHDKQPEYERGHMNLVTAMEEMGELSQAISQRMRGRTNDNYDILEEMGDVILSIWCVAQKYNISHADIRKAINVKVERERKRIERHKAVMALKEETIDRKDNK